LLLASRHSVREDVVQPMKSTVKNVFFAFGGDEASQIQLSTDPATAPTLPYDLFARYRNIHANVEMSRDDQDGAFHTLLIGFFIDGTEEQYVTDWFPNTQVNRVGEYAFGVPGYAKYRDANKVHAVQIKLGNRKWMQNATVNGRIVNLRAREYDLPSEGPSVYYYRVSAKPDRE